MCTWVRYRLRFLRLLSAIRSCQTQQNAANQLSDEVLKDLWSNSVSDCKMLLCGSMLSGPVSMMSAEDCRTRAQHCLAAAQHSSDRDARRAWRRLSDMWFLGSGKVVELSPQNDERSEAPGNAANAKRPVPAAEPVGERPIFRNEKAAETADRLRLRLALSETLD